MLPEYVRKVNKKFISFIIEVGGFYMEAREAIEVLKKNYPKTVKMVDGRYKGGFVSISLSCGNWNSPLSTE